MTTIEHVWVIRGVPLNPSQEQWPCTVHDMHSRRLRCQYAPRDIALALDEWNGMSKMTARWCPDVGDRGEWALIDFIPDTPAKAAQATVLP